MLAIYLFTPLATTLEALRERVAGSFDVSPIKGGEFLIEPRSPDWIRIAELGKHDFEVPIAVSKLMPGVPAPRCFEVQHHDLKLLQAVLVRVLDKSVVVDDECGQIEPGNIFRDELQSRLNRYWHALQSTRS